MDLTKTYPRSPYAKLGNLYMLGRTVDKARAKLDGDLGEYLYDCPLDKRLFDFLGISAGQLLKLAENSESDEGVVESLKTIQVERNTEEIEKFNDQIAESGPTTMKVEFILNGSARSMFQIGRKFHLGSTS